MSDAALDIPTQGVIQAVVQNTGAPCLSSSESGVEGELFAPPGVVFKQIEKAWAAVNLLINGIWLIALMLVILAVAFLNFDEIAALAWWWWLLLAVPVALFLWILWLLPRQRRAWGYAEEPKNLYIRRGIMFKKMWAVPYGRMQYVDVTQGPLERIFKIATVSLKTASQETDAKIPGLRREEADRIRKLLTERGEAQRAGL